MKQRVTSRFKTAIRRAYYRLYIRWLALNWIPQINLGDEVMHNGVVRSVSNGVYENYWTLLNPYEERVPKSECRKVWTLRNMLCSYRAGVRFYEGYWLHSWVDSGIRPWVRELPIWPRWWRKGGAA